MSVRGLAKIYQPRVLAALLAAYSDIRSAAVLADIERLLAARDFEGALRAVGIDAAAFGEFEAVLRDAYGASGREFAASVPKLADPLTATRAAFRFDVRNARAEAFLRDHAGQLITRIVNEQREAVRIAMQGGLEAGANPRQTALDIVGRIDPITRKRAGGAIGLNAQQSRYVRSARAELRDPERLAKYLTRERRDKRFDAAVRRAMRDGVPLDQATANKLADRYSDRLLALRGETIARTETLTALRKAKLESITQLIDTGRIRKDQVRKIWDTAGDDRVRDSHVAMDGVSVAVDEPFVLPDGSRLMFPGDASMGAPGAETIDCRCVMQTKVDFLAGVL